MGQTSPGTRELIMECARALHLGEVARVELSHRFYNP